MQTAGTLTAEKDIAMITLGYRVKTSDGWYVHHHETHGMVILFAAPEKTGPTSKADAYRLMALWLDAGYLPALVHVFHKKVCR